MTVTTLKYFLSNYTSYNIWRSCDNVTGKHCSAHQTVIGIVVLLSYDGSRDNDTGKQYTPDCDWNRRLFASFLLVISCAVTHQHVAILEFLSCLRWQPRPTLTATRHRYTDTSESSTLMIGKQTDRQTDTGINNSFNPTMSDWRLITNTQRYWYKRISTKHWE